MSVSGAGGNTEAIDPNSLTRPLRTDQPGHDPGGENAGRRSQCSDFYPTVIEVLLFRAGVSYLRRAVVV